MWRPQTIARPIVVEGVALHAGSPVRATLRPSSTLSIGPMGAARPLCLANVQTQAGGTGIVDGPQVIEHLLAAVAAVGLTGLQVEVAGPELPVLDGAARAWVDALMDAGLTPAMGGEAWRVTAPFVHAANGGQVQIAPARQALRTVDVSFGPNRSGVWAASVPGVGRWVDARTFVPEEWVSALSGSDRGRGANRLNTVVWAADGSGGAMTGEPVAHKLLDLIGDCMVLGGPLLGHVHAVRGSHRLHVEALRAAVDAGAIRAA